MEELLLFQVGTLQLGIDLAYTKSIQSAKPNFSEQEGENARLTQVVDGKEIPLYDLLSVFDKDNVFSSPTGKKVIAVESQNKPMGLIVDRINQVVPVDSDQIKSLSPIFRTSSLAYFPKVLKHDNQLILLFTPEGLTEIDQQVLVAGNYSQIPDSEITSPSMQEDTEQEHEKLADEEQNEVPDDNWQNSKDNSPETNEESLSSDFMPAVEIEKELISEANKLQTKDIDDTTEINSASTLAQEQSSDQDELSQMDMAESNAILDSVHQNLTTKITGLLDFDIAELVSEVEAGSATEKIEEHRTADLENEADSQASVRTLEPFIDSAHIAKTVSSFLQEDLLAVEVEKFTTKAIKKVKLNDIINRIFTQAVEDLSFRIKKRKATRQSQLNPGMVPK